MPSSEVRVELHSPNALADILLINSRFEIVARGPSPLEATVSPGLYSAKVKIGDEETEQVIALTPDVPRVVKNLDAPRFSSPIPLEGTSTSREYHQAAAAKYVGRVASHLNLGTGSTVMVCVRDPSGQNFDKRDQALARYEQSFRGFRVLDADGAVIAELDELADTNPQYGYMAARVEVDPGSYVLAYGKRGKEFCVAMPTAAGWTLQAYLQLVPTHKQDEARPDFGDMAFAFGREDAAFDPHDESLKFLETVRKGLLEGRNYADGKTMRRLLTDKFDNPMLGLYAAHLLLLDPKADVSLIATIVQNLSRMLGADYPDVLALAWGLKNKAPKTPGVFPDFKSAMSRLTGPPLIARSWDYLVDAAREVHSNLFATSPAFAPAGNLLPQGIYLTWRVPPADPQHTDAGSARVWRGLERAMPSPAKSAPSLMGSVLDGVASIAHDLLKALRGKVTESPAGPPPVADIENIQTTDQAAKVLQWLGRSYDWKGLLPQLRQDTPLFSRLTPLQKMLLRVLRSASGDNDALEALDAKYVEDLLQRNRVPVQTLARALADIEAGGFLATNVRLALKT